MKKIVSDLKTLVLRLEEVVTSGSLEETTIDKILKKRFFRQRIEAANKQTVCQKCKKEIKKSKSVSLSFWANYNYCGNIIELGPICVACVALCQFDFDDFEGPEDLFKRVTGKDIRDMSPTNEPRILSGDSTGEDPETDLLRREYALQQCLVSLHRAGLLTPEFVDNYKRLMEVL